jgi:4-hydroxybenzoate polyprenyltransferase
LSAVLRICDFLFVLRPVILIPAWSFYLIGAAEAGRSTGSWSDAVPLAAVAVCLTAILAAAYVLNQIFDRESDERNNKCLFLSRGIFRVRTLVWMAIVSLLIAGYAFRHAVPEARPWLAAALALSLVYSLPPVRLCARPFLDLVANAVGYGMIAFVLGYGAFGSSWTPALWASVPYVFLVAATFLHTTVLDFSGDRAAGKTSTSIVIGIRASAAAAAVLHVVAFAFSLATRSGTAAAVTGVSLPVTAFPLFNRSIGASAVVVQANTLVVTAAAVLHWPAYIAVVAPLVVLSRFYHRRRFGIIYPGPARVV